MQTTVMQQRCPCGIPFAHVHQDGIAWVERNADEAFRKALMDGVPATLRGKMQRALAAIPDPGRDYAHSVRYFGDRLLEIARRVAPLRDLLDDYMRGTLGLPGFGQWLDLTGYANHYEMVKVFDEWALMKKGTRV
jgi:hypothetical protein